MAASDPATFDSSKWTTALGVGRAPLMPGTAGSAVSAIAFLPCAIWLPVEPLFVLCLGVALLFSAVTVGDGKRLAMRLETKDPSAVISDEVAGVFLCFALLAALPAWQSTLLGFAGFRLFDVLKPFGIRRLERLPGGWGILSDDLAAGVAAAILVHAMMWMWGTAPGMVP